MGVARGGRLGIAVSSRALFALDEFDVAMFDREHGLPIGRLALGDTWAAAFFPDGQVEVWGDEAQASEALFCEVGNDSWARWETCAKTVTVRGRLASWLDAN